MISNTYGGGSPYFLAQSAMAQLKAAIHQVLEAAPKKGLRNADIGRSLGIYMGHVEHEGHVSRTLLAIMESEGVVEQDKDTKFWKLVSFPGTDIEQFAQE